jgi:hypothetical protein
MRSFLAGRAVTRLLMTIALFGFIGWAYIAGNAISHPYTLHLQLTHLAAWPHEDDFALGCFVASAVAYFLLQLAGHADQ